MLGPNQGQCVPRDVKPQGCSVVALGRELDVLLAQDLRSSSRPTAEPHNRRGYTDFAKVYVHRTGPLLLVDVEHPGLGKGPHLGVVRDFGPLRICRL